MAQLGNKTASAYLRALLLMGARREELASLTWANVNFRWRKLTIADKVESTRTIPLTPYMAQIEAYILMLAGEQLDVDAEPGKLGVVAGEKIAKRL